MTDVTVAVRPLPHFEGLDLPAYETLGAAGMDVRAAVPEGEPLVLEPGMRVMVPTGLSVAIPQGFEIQMRPRSGPNVLKQPAIFCCCFCTCSFLSYRTKFFVAFSGNCNHNGLALLGNSGSCAKRKCHLFRYD